MYFVDISLFQGYPKITPRLLHGNSETTIQMFDGFTNTTTHNNLYIKNECNKCVAKCKTQKTHIEEYIPIQLIFFL